MRRSLKKLDARSRFELVRGDYKGPIDALLRLEGPPTKQHREALQHVGCEITATMGAVVSISIDSARLQELADLPFVRSIEMARPLFPESR
jgi:hypothetical protein